MKFDTIEWLYDLQYTIAKNHPAEKADLFIEFLCQRKEITGKLDKFEKFIAANFKEEISKG